MGLSARHGVQLLPALVLAVGLCGCAMHSDYNEAVASGRTAIPWAAEFERIYPGTYHYITHYNLKGQPRWWNSEAFLFDRYEIIMQIPDIRFDASDRHVVGWGTPHFYVTEIVRVDEDHRSIEHGQQLDFGPDEWRKLVAAKGDLTAVGIKVDKHHPVPGIEIEKQASH